MAGHLNCLLTSSQLLRSSFTNHSVTLLRLLGALGRLLRRNKELIVFELHFLLAVSRELQF